MTHPCFLEPQRLSFPQFEQSGRWRPSFEFYKSAAQTGVFVVAAVIALVVWPALAPPLIIIGISVGIARLVIKMTGVYNAPLTERMHYHLARFRDRHRLVQIVGLIAVLSIAMISWQAASLLAIPLGIYAAVVIGLDRKTGAQQANAQGDATRTSCF